MQIAKANVAILILVNLRRMQFVILVYAVKTVSCNLDECDLPDVCSGTSSYCLQNIYKEDERSCLDSQAYCFVMLIAQAMM